MHIFSPPRTREGHASLSFMRMIFRGQTVAQMPSHDHPMQASSGAASTAEGAGAALAQTAENSYAAAAPDTNLAAESVGTSGSGQGHDNMQPYLALHFIIALSGLFPPRN